MQSYFNLFILRTHLAHLLIFISLNTVPLLARADVYEYIDEDGLVYLTDVPPDERYVMILKSEDSQAPSNLGANADTSNTNHSITSTDLFAQIDQSAKQYQIDSELIHAVIHVESAFKTQATSSKGAQGLMQLMPATAARLGVQNSYNSSQNIAGGAKYLRELLNLFHNDVSLAVAAYNAGENAVIKYGYRIPPYKETQAYVPRVLAVYKALLKQRPQAI